MSRTGLLGTIALSLALGLVQCPTFAGSIPGQDITSRASITWCEQAQLSTAASVSYVDADGTIVDQASAQPASVQAEITTPPITSNPAKSFVAPASNAPVYFTLSRSLYSGASLVGQNVKLVGKVRTVGGVQYIDDGAAIVTSDPATGKNTTVSSMVPIRSDLLTNALADGALVAVQGVCRIETDGRPALLPLSDSAVTAIQ